VNSSLDDFSHMFPIAVRGKMRPSVNKFTKPRNQDFERPYHTVEPSLHCTQ